jgi:hypothetical protein
MAENTRLKSRSPIEPLHMDMLKSLHVVDDHTCETLAMRVGRTRTADDVVETHQHPGLRPARAPVAPPRLTG